MTGILFLRESERGKTKAYNRGKGRVVEEVRGRTGLGGHRNAKQDEGKLRGED